MAGTSPAKTKPAGRLSGREIFPGQPCAFVKAITCNDPLLISAPSQGVLQNQPDGVLGHSQGFGLVVSIGDDLWKVRDTYGKTPLFLWFQNHCEFLSLHRNAF